MDSVLVPLLSAIAGAFIGGIISLLVSLLATKRVAKSNVELAANERKMREEQEQLAAISSVLAEMQAALEIFNQPDTLTRNTLVTFSMDIWKSNLGSLGPLGSETEHIIQVGYAEMALANAFAIQNLHPGYRLGSLNDSYKGHVRAMEDRFCKAIESIEQWLRQNPHVQNDS